MWTVLNEVQEAERLPFCVGGIGVKDRCVCVTSVCSYVYMLGKKTWVERWPSEAECTSDAALQAKCTVLKAAAKDLTNNGCKQ